MSRQPRFIALPFSALSSSFSGAQPLFSPDSVKELSIREYRYRKFALTYPSLTHLTVHLDVGSSSRDPKLDQQYLFAPHFPNVTHLSLHYPSWDAIPAMGITLPPSIISLRLSSEQFCHSRSDAYRRLMGFCQSLTGDSIVSIQLLDEGTNIASEDQVFQSSKEVLRARNIDLLDRHGNIINYA
ncbi:hypothetical protein ONZ45_g10461 [Pleurotus djamor]|nr:hypothetical protein ONZ45_g10461 [Pleurotus djamor]